MLLVARPGLPSSFLFLGGDEKLNFVRSSRTAQQRAVDGRVCRKLSKTFHSGVFGFSSFQMMSNSRCPLQPVTPFRPQGFLQIRGIPSGCREQAAALPRATQSRVQTHQSNPWCQNKNSSKASSRTKMLYHPPCATLHLKSLNSTKESFPGLWTLASAVGFMQNLGPSDTRVFEIADPIWSGPGHPSYVRPYSGQTIGPGLSEGFSPAVKQK